ncbi:hypothetical protein N2152v2_002885 [Parachlorella kessleri]
MFDMPTPEAESDTGQTVTTDSPYSSLNACPMQCITNAVSNDLMANTLLACGASPAMAHAATEVEDFVGIASALLINVGTLSPDWVESMKLAAKAACRLGKVWVLDPVGCGATPYRSQVCRELLELRPNIVRGNASEIMALAGVTSSIKGVDSTAQSNEALEAGQALATEFGCVVGISGAVDLVTDGRRVLHVANGVPMLQQITASGCSVTALAAAFACLFPQEPLEATAHALAYFGLAGELAARDAKGPGSLRVGLLDNLWTLSEEEVLGCVKLTEGRT